MHSPVRIGCLELAGDPKYAPEAQTPSCRKARGTKQPSAKKGHPPERHRQDSERRLVGSTQPGCRAAGLAG
eukprot:g32522.t1